MIPLWQRLYTQPHLYELARIIGYAGLPLREVQERVRPVGEKHGKEKMMDAIDELCHVDTGVDPHMMRLTPEIRKFCAQLLGLPPEHPEYEDWKNNVPWVPPWARKPPETIQDLTEEVLRSRLREAHERLTTVSPRSKIGKELKKEITAVRVEFKRRGMDANLMEEEVLSKK